MGRSSRLALLKKIQSANFFLLLYEEPHPRLHRREMRLHELSRCDDVWRYSLTGWESAKGKRLVELNGIIRMRKRLLIIMSLLLVPAIAYAQDPNAVIKRIQSSGVLKISCPRFQERNLVISGVLTETGQATTSTG